MQSPSQRPWRQEGIARPVGSPIIPPSVLASFGCFPSNFSRCLPPTAAVFSSNLLFTWLNFMNFRYLNYSYFYITGKYYLQPLSFNLFFLSQKLQFLPNHVLLSLLYFLLSLSVGSWLRATRFLLLLSLFFLFDISLSLFFLPLFQHFPPFLLFPLLPIQLLFLPHLFFFLFHFLCLLLCFLHQLPL